MKKILSLLFLSLLLADNAAAQTVFTPNRNLALPPAAPGTWGEQYNNNFIELDTSKIPRVTVNTRPSNPTLNTVVIVTNALNGTTCNQSGGTAQNTCQWDGSNWVVVGGSTSGGAGVGHTIQDETTVLPQRGNLNFTGGGVNCVDNAAQNRTDCIVPTGSVDQAATYTWTGANTWRDATFSITDNTDTTKIAKFELGGQTTGTTRTYSMPDASTRLMGDSDFSTTGVMSRTGANTYAGRTLQSGNTNYLAWTNADGVSGNPSINIGANVVATDRANTYTAGSKQTFTPSATTSGLNLGSLAGDPSSPANGDIWYNSTTGKFRKREGGSTTDLDTTGGAVGFSAITAGTNVNALVVGNLGSLNTTGTGTITANRTPCIAGQYLAFDGTCPAAATAVDQTAAFTWTGAHTWRDNNWSLLDQGDTTKILKFDIAGFTTATTRTMTLPDASTRLLGDSDFAGTGFLARTGASAYAPRTFATANANRISITNPTGGGNPTWDLGTDVLLINRSATMTTGDYNFAAASSFTFPTATGAAPTLSGRCAYDSTANRLKCGFNGSTVTLATVAETQPLNTNLTALSGLTGAANGLPMFSGAGAMALKVVATCGGGQALTYNGSAYSCVSAGGGGLSGLTIGKYVISTGATTADTSGTLSESGGIVNASGGFSIGSSPWLIFDTSAIASSDKTWSILNFSGTIRPSTGALTAGHYVTTDANGLLIDGGAPGAGGTVTNIATTAPITGGAITTTGTIACATCVTSAAALTSNRIVLGAGSQATAALGSLGTTTTLLHGNAAGAPSFSAVALAADVSGTLPVANGGTGSTTFTAGIVRGSGTSALTGSELSGDVTTSGSNATTIAANAVTSGKMAAVNTRRTCMIVVGDGSNAIQSADFSPFKQGRCYVPYAATIQEITLQGDTGTASVLLQRRRDAATVADLLSAALATAGTTETCAKSSTSVACINGTTSDGSITLSNTALAAGDWVEVKSGTGALSTTSLSIAVVFTVN